MFRIMSLKYHCNHLLVSHCTLKNYDECTNIIECYSRTQVHEHPRANRSPGTGLDINAVIHGDRVSYGDTTPPRRVDDKAEIESQRKQIRELVASVKKMSLQCDEKNRELKLIRSTMKNKLSPKNNNNMKMESSIRNLFLSSRRSSGSSS